MKKTYYRKRKKTARQAIPATINPIEIAATQLDELALNIINRGVFVVQPNGDFYTIMNYFTKRTVIDRIPNATWANLIIDYVNYADHNSMQLVQKLVDHYHFLSNDASVLEYQISRVRDVNRNAVLSIKLHETRWRCNELFDMLRAQVRAGSHARK